MDVPAVVRIADASDARLRDFVGLRDAGLRRSLEAEHGLYVAEGAVVAGRALAAGHRPRAFLGSGATVGEAAPLAPPGVPVYVVPGDVMRALAGFDVHRGFLASFERPPLPEPADVVRGATRVVLLEDLADPGNVGAVFRSVAALGADAVIVSNRCADPLYRHAVRASMGAVFQVPWTRVRDWQGFLSALAQMDFSIAVLSPQDDAHDLGEWAARPARRVALLVGAEARGVRPRTRARGDAVVRIPMANGVGSLNVATAAAVAMWALGPGASGPVGGERQ